MRPALRTHALPALYLLALVMLVNPRPVAADAVAQLPSAWQNTLQAIPETDLSGAERIGRDAISETRVRLSELLHKGETDAANLAEGYGQLGALYQLFNIDTAAARCWDNARKLQPADYRWSYYAAYLALNKGHTDTARVLLQQTRELNPDYAPLDLRMGQLWLDTNELDKAEAALYRAAAQPGLRGAALYYLGQIDLLRRDYESAVEHLTEALDINPQASEVHYPLAQAYRHIGEQALAREHLARFKDRTPEAEDPLVTQLQTVLETSRRDFSLGMQAINERDYETAIQHFSKGLEIDPDNLAARVSYARALYLGGKKDEAQKQLDTVVDRDPEQVLANFLLAVLMEAADKPEKAVELYRRVLRIDPRHEGARFYLANLMFQLGRFEEAAVHYEQALIINPDIPPARLLQIVALHHAGQADADSVQLLETRIEAYPDQAELKYALVRLRSLSQDAVVHDSVKALQVANQLAPNQPTPPNIEVLALAAAADGQFEQAAKLQQQLIEGLGWMAAAQQVQALQETLDAYQQDRLPEQAVWPLNDPLLSPLPLNPADPFSYYPAAVPF